MKSKATAKKGFSSRKIGASKISIKNLEKNLNSSTRASQEKFFSRYSQNEIEKIRERAIEQGNERVLKATINAINKSAGFKGAELRKQNKANLDYYRTDLINSKEIQKKINRDKRAITKLKNIAKKHELQLTNELYIKGIIPNPKVLKEGIDAFINKAVFRNDKMNPKFKTKDVEVVKERARLKFEELQRKASQIKATQIKNYAINEQIYHMEYVYFKNGDYDLQAEINEYLQYLPIDKILDIQNVLHSDEFKQIWDSDDNGKISDENQNERARARQERLIQILQEETGKIINVSPNKEVQVSDYKRVGDKHLLFSHYTK